MDAISVLKDDHRAVEELFVKFEGLGPNAKVTKARTVDKITELLSIHAAIEEMVFYPAVRKEVDDTTSEVLESIEEHHVVKILLTELEHLPVEDERYDAKVTVLIENTRHHVEEEETDLFPQVRKALPRKRLVEIGEALTAAKKSAPTRPHVLSPSTPPGNVVVGAVAGVVDKLRGH
jgi:hemerythrin-like domain-containing protein